jgi:hypothetical protein
MIHVKWTAEIGQQLDQLRIHLDDQLRTGNGRIISSLQFNGFALLSGIGKGNDRQLAASQLLELAKDLGRVLPQSPSNELIEDIRDFSDVDDKDERGYRSRGELTAHSDPPTLIVLHCLHEAMTGGESYLVNLRAIHDEMEQNCPQMLEQLYGSFPYWLVAGQAGGPGPAPTGRPILMQHEGQVSCALYRPFVEKAAEYLQHPLTEEQVNALDMFDYYANSKQLALRFYLAPGETLILHNRTVLHARTDYRDWPQQHRRRHLLRLWIDAPELLPVASEHELGNIFAAASPN